MGSLLWYQGARIMFIRSRIIVYSRLLRDFSCRSSFSLFISGKVVFVTCMPGFSFLLSSSNEVYSENFMRWERKRDFSNNGLFPERLLADFVMVSSLLSIDALVAILHSSQSYLFDGSRRSLRKFMEATLLLFFPSGTSIVLERVRNCLLI